MRLIDGDKIVTIQLYNDEYEEYLEEKMSIIDYVNAYTDEGVIAADNVLEQIRSEIENLNCEYIDYNTGCSAYVSQNDVLQIINNHTKGDN